MGQPPKKRESHRQKKTRQRLLASQPLPPQTAPTPYQRTRTQQIRIQRQPGGKRLTKRGASQGKASGLPAPTTPTIIIIIRQQPQQPRPRLLRNPRGMYMLLLQGVIMPYANTNAIHLHPQAPWKAGLVWRDFERRTRFSCPV